MRFSSVQFHFKSNYNMTLVTDNIFPVTYYKYVDPFRFLEDRFHIHRLAINLKIDDYKLHMIN